MILSDSDIRACIKRGSIVIDPFDDAALGPNSYDVHLGPFMLVYQARMFELLDAARDNPVEELHQDGPGSWVLGPGRVYLASTAEYTETHAHVPYLDGKSSVGRLGIAIHATAGRGDIGFCNHWTMELVVAQPVRVYAGMPIGQLTYHVPLSMPEVGYGARPNSKYQGRDPRPQPSRMFKNFPGGR